MIVRDIVSGGRRVAAGLVGRLAGQERAVTNARRASTEVSRRRVERDEVTIYLESLHRSARTPSTRGTTGRARTSG